MVSAQPLGFNYDTGKWDVLVRSDNFDKTGECVVREFDNKYDARKFNYEVNHKSCPKCDTFEKGVITEEDITKNKPAKKEKHFFKALVSAFITGGGQILDGRIGEGLKQNLTSAALALGGYVGAVLLSAKGKLPLAMVASNAAVVGLIVNKIHSIKDAYNGGNKD